MRVIGFVFSAFALVVSVYGYSGSPRFEQEGSCVPDFDSLAVVLANGVRMDSCSTSTIPSEYLVNPPNSVMWVNAHKTKYYTLVQYYYTSTMSTLEWAVRNIYCDDLIKGDIYKGKEVTRYQLADAWEETGTHNLVLLVETSPNQEVYGPDQLEGFNPDFFEEQGLEGPVAGLSITTENQRV